MSTAPSQWHAWLRRHTGVECLGPPRTFFAWVTIALSLLVIVYVGAWNAQHYPVALGYDAPEHISYSDTIVHKGHLPSRTESGEYKAPPGYYALAGGAAWLGTRLGASPQTYRGAQYLNLVLVIGTALLLLALARLVAPGRPNVWGASLAYFAMLPVVAKTAAMFHPETLNMFLSTLALWLATLILQKRRQQLRRAIPLAAVLGAGLLVRSSMLFTLIAIAIGIGCSYLSPKRIRQLSRRNVVVAVLVSAALAGAWLAFNRAPDLALGLLHPGSRTAVSTRAHFWQLGLSEVFHVPFRPYFVNEALPLTYTEIWGDWVGAFSWSSYSAGPWPPALKVMQDQNSIGLLPTALAIGGWALLIGRALRGRRELLVIAALPTVALFGYFYRSYQFLSTDGDLLKASYVLTTAPVWALGFAFAYESLSRFRLLRLGIVACLALFAVLELRFMLYGIRDHRPIF